MTANKPRTYAKAGVDIRREEQTINAIRSWMTKTFQFRKDKAGQVLDDIGSFANLVDLGEKALAIATDGVGSKVLVAQELGKYDTIGIDLVAMNVNDIICCGAEPLCMVDYLAMQCMDYSIAKEIAAGIYVGAEQAGIAVVGGETASLPDIICGVGDKGFDLAGTVVGIVDKKNIITGDDITPGDTILGIKSSGIHSNGLTLARKLLPKSMWLNLLTPTHIYVKEALTLIQDYTLKGMANVTGGGLLNLTRVTEHGLSFTNLPQPQMVFRKMQELGGVSDAEMYRTFNMGVGFTLFTDPKTAADITASHGKTFEIEQIGEVTEKPGLTFEAPLTGETVTLK